MTRRKSDIPLNSRLTAYVSRETGAAELQVSPSTWDEMVDCNQIPKPIQLGRMGTIERWRWADVDNRLRGGDRNHPVQEPYFRERSDGT
jgi:predicted DNA-binding transcriptional regulator AlpA